MSTRYNFKSKVRDLQLADVIRLDGTGPFCDAVVTQIKDGMVHLWRPYGHTDDFSYTGGVIPYIGLETFQISQDIDYEYHVYQRKELK